MFTGLIQDIGVIRAIDKARGDWRIEIETTMQLGSVPMGASICCSGCCLTVVEKAQNSFFVDVSAESLGKTVIGSWCVGSRINIEPSLKLGDEMGGHIVSGHVDTVSELVEVTPDGDSHRLLFSLPKGFEKFIAPKGSVTIDGISLTVNEVTQIAFGVNIIPHTWQETTLGDRRVGDQVNIEIDTIARYVARMLEFKD